MVLVVDNTPYHYKWEIDSLSGLNKAQLVDLMVEHEVEYIDIPINSHARHDLAQTHGDEDSDVQDRGDCVQIDFIPEEQK